MKIASNCLNCGREINENFCPNCGQKTSVHRYSFKHFIEHDIVHGIWHVDKGFLFTIKELFSRPGSSVREFLQGKRLNLFNVITLLIIILGIGHFLGEYTHVKFADLVSEEKSKKIMNAFEEFAEKYPKIILLILIPIYSFFSFLWFRKAKLNLTEHFILNAYMTVGTLIISTLFTIISIFYQNLEGLRIILYFVQFLSLLYIIWFYYDFFKHYKYKKFYLIFSGIALIFSVQFFYLFVGIIIGYLKLI